MTKKEIKYFIGHMVPRDDDSYECESDLNICICSKCKQRILKCGHFSLEILYTFLEMEELMMSPALHEDHISSLYRKTIKQLEKNEFILTTDIEDGYIAVKTTNQDMEYLESNGVFCWCKNKSYLSR